MDQESLKEWRKGHGLTRKQLAKMLGVTQMAIAYWEWGRRTIPSLLPLALEALENRIRKVGGRKNGSVS